MTVRFAVCALVVCVLLVASVGTAAASVPATLSADIVAQTDGGFLAGLQDTLESVDEFLETVVDLVRTISRLTGEGGE